MGWADYFWLGTTVLRNKLGLTEAALLREAEHLLASGRSVELECRSAPISKTHDSEHLCALHRWLFQDVFDWAGRYRDVSISKQISSFAPVDRIDECLRRATDLVTTTRWDRVDDAGFAEVVAEVFSWLNFAHPFRDGNGRATRLFMDAVATQSGRTLDYSAVGQDVWIQRCAFSIPDLDQERPQHQWLVPVFSALMRPLS